MLVSPRSKSHVFNLLMVFVSALGLHPLVSADHTVAPGSVALVGSLQDELGCPGDWQPDCVASELSATGSVWQATFSLPEGSYEYKVALNDGWAEAYGESGNNIPLNIGPGGADVTFTYDHVTHLVSDDAPAVFVQPASVTIAGKLQDELGCSGDWQADCSATHLTLDTSDGVWQGFFDVPAGDFEYKAPINDSWDEDYGKNATRNGPYISVRIAGHASVKFFYDHRTD